MSAATEAVDGERSRPFDDLPATAASHYALHSYGALVCLLRWVYRQAPEGQWNGAEVLERHRFLGDYLLEISDRLGGFTRWGEAARLWRAHLARWEERAAGHLPLLALQRRFRLTPDSMAALMLAVLPEEDSRFGELIGELQRSRDGRPSVELIGTVLSDDPERSVDGWKICSPLVRSGVLETDARDGQPRAQWRLKVHCDLLDLIRGITQEWSAAGLQLHPLHTLTPISELILDEATREEVTRLTSAAAATVAGPALTEPTSAQLRYVMLRGDHGTDSVEAAGALARSWGRSLLEVNDGDRLCAERRATLAATCTLLGATLAVAYPQAGPGTTIAAPEASGHATPLILLLGHEGGLEESIAGCSVTLSLPFPGRSHRRRLWEAAAGPLRIEDLDTVAARFLLPSGIIRQTAQIAAHDALLKGSRTISLEAVRAAARSLNHHRLDELAERLSAEGCWSDLVAPPSTDSQLAQLEQRCRHRERILEGLGTAFRHVRNRGVRALFTGPSGTGKTLAARILGSVLDMDLFRVDLSAVINKYIGETEKNLHQILARAESLDVVLLLDEGDSLLGGRTEVRSSNDRYANLETNFLLQRLEHYNGIVVVTTNLEQNIDRAFQRRMDVVVAFQPPSPLERAQILDLHLPEDHQVSRELLEEVSLRCELSGGQLRNLVLGAALQALDGSGVVADDELLRALRAEFRKSGGFFPLDQTERGPASGARTEGLLEGMF